MIYNYLNAGHFHQLPNRVHQPDRIRYVDVDGSRTVSLEDAEALYPVLTMAGATSLVEGAGDSSASAARLAAPAAPVIEGSFPTSELPTSELPAISEDALVLVDELVPVDAWVPEGAFVSEEPMRKVATGGEEAFDANHNPDGSETGTVSDGLSSADLPALERSPSGLVGFDHATVMLDAEATAFPVIDVDYSANDTIMGATLVGVSKPQWGQVEWFADAGLEGRPVLRYTPGPEFSGHDSFTYTVADEEGFEWTGHVNVQVEQERTAFSPFTVTAPAEPLTLSGESLDFVSAEGEPLLQVAYDGLASVTGSLYLAWVSGIQEDAQEVFAGSLSLRSDSELEGWNSLSNGSAWMTGSIAELNAALGQLVYAPAQGFTAPGGVTLVVHVALQSTLGLWVNDTFATMEVIVPAGPGGPIAVGDSFTLEGSGTEFRLDVLANDLPATDAADSMLELVGLTPSPYSPAVIRLDAETGQVVYQVDPSISVIYDTFAYVLRDSQGRVSQGQVTIALNATAKTEPEEALVVVEEGSVESFEDDLLSASLSQDEAS